MNKRNKEATVPAWIKEDMTNIDEHRKYRNLFVLFWLIFIITGFMGKTLLANSENLLVVVGLIGLISAILSLIFLFKTLIRLYIKNCVLIAFILYLIALFIPIGWMISLVIVVSVMRDSIRVLRRS